MDGQLVEPAVLRILSELGCPSIEDLMKRYDAAGGELLVCPICFNARQLNDQRLVTNARLGGTVALWEWIGDGATTFSY